MTTPHYPISLTGYQMRILHETLSVILNDPDWEESLGFKGRDWTTLVRAAEIVRDGLTTARRAESTPAGDSHA